MFYKITNKKERQNGFQYVDGPNILKGKFNDDPNESCCSGGLYFTDITNIFKFLEYGFYLREVILPTLADYPDFKIVKDKSGDKWRANIIILGRRYNLNNINTFKYLLEKGADIGNDNVLLWSAGHGYLDIVNFLVANGAAIQILSKMYSHLIKQIIV
jgi:hypothetical protein